ncbi:MAG: nickel-dependent lactate racemase [Candidatus Bathyarchaeia archaeon]
MEYWIPYGKTEVPVRVPDENLIGVIDCKETSSALNASDEVVRAIENPLCSPRLEELLKPGEKVCIVVDDKTRPTPSHLMVRPLLGLITRAGIKPADITIVFGCGTHKTMRLDEVGALLGEDCVRDVVVNIHDAEASDLVDIGETSFGTKVKVNRAFAEADVRIITGDVEFHYFAGYGGGRKSVLPAITDAQSTQHNHSFLLDPRARAGNLEGNPVHLDMVEAAHLLKVDFAVNLVLNSRKEMVQAFAGDMDKVFQEGVRLVDSMYKIPVDSPADIVVVSPGGYPADIDLYQACKGLEFALNVVKEGGVVVLVAECIEGYGHKLFFDWMLRYKTFAEVQKEVKKKFVLGGHKAYYLMKALEKAKIVLVSTLPDYYASSVFHLRTAKTANTALNMAFRILNRRGKVLVLPHGSFTLPVLKEESEG